VVSEDFYGDADWWKPEPKTECEHGVEFAAPEECEPCRVENDHLFAEMHRLLEETWRDQGSPGAEYEGLTEEEALEIWKAGWIAGVFGPYVADALLDEDLEDEEG